MSMYRRLRRTEAAIYAQQWIHNDDACEAYRAEAGITPGVDFDPLTPAERHNLFAYVRDWLDDVVEESGPLLDVPIPRNGHECLVEALCEYLGIGPGSQTDEGFRLARLLWAEAAMGEPRRSVDLQRRDAIRTKVVYKRRKDAGR